MTTEPHPEKPSNGNDSSRGFSGVPVYVAELGEYAGHWVNAKLDLLKLSARNALLVAILGLMAALIGVAVVATSVVLLLVGISEGLGVLFGGRYWLGSMVVGLIVMGGFAAFGMYVLARLKMIARDKTVRKYEAAREHQRSRFGRDVAQGAATAGRVAT